jgi:protoheme IX farnesyltransferase
MTVAKRIGARVALAKLKISAPVALTAFFGYLYAGGSPLGAIPATLGAFLLATGSAAANHAQDREIDARMERTRSRPIPSGIVSVEEALLVSVFLILAGSATLVFLCGWIPYALGVAAILWYNGVYAALKRLTAYAAAPGALVGAIPPAIGWTAAGGDPTAPGFVAMVVFFFLWQTPHFWILLMIRREDYRRAGLPSAADRSGVRALAFSSYVWIAATGAAGVGMAIFLGASLPWVVSVGVVALGALALSVGLVKTPDDRAALRLAFMSVNGFTLVCAAIVAAERAIEFYH